MALTKIELLQLIYSKEEVIIDLGCGPNKLNNSIGIDVLDIDNVDFVANLEEGLDFLPDNSVDEINTRHFLEHIINFEKLMVEMCRVLKPKGKINITVPHFSNPYYYSDYTHKRFFGLYSFDYFSSTETGFKRTVPNYINLPIVVEKRNLYFKSPHFFIINTIKKHIFNRLFNANKYMQAIYEDCFSRIIPCYELQFILTKPLKPKQ